MEFSINNTTGSEGKCKAIPFPTPSSDYSLNKKKTEKNHGHFIVLWSYFMIRSVRCKREFAVYLVLHSLFM